MSKICCLGDANVCPKSSSCSMVLRSACSHKHFPESSTVKEQLRASPSSRKSKHKVSTTEEVSCNGNNLHLKSLESSLNQFTIKSVENSILADSLSSSTELSESACQKLTEENSISAFCVKKLHFSQLSALNNSSIYEKCSSDYSSATESDMNSSEPLEYTTNMSTRRYTRSSVTSTRSFSGSEDDDISIHRIVKPFEISRRSISKSVPSHTSKRVFSKEQINSQNISNNHTTFGDKLYTGTPGSSDYNSRSHFSESSPSRLTVQTSLFHKFRWFLWRCIYLKIIKTVNFDVWLLSRIHSYGKYKVIFCLLLPLLFFLFWHAFPHISLDSLSQVLYSVTSSVLYIPSIFSSTFSYFVQMCPQFIYAGSSIMTEESTSLNTETNYEPKEPIYHQTEELDIIQSKKEIKLLQLEISSLKELLKTSIQETEANKLKQVSELQDQIKKLQLAFQSLSGIVSVLEEDIKEQKEKSKTKEDIILLTNEYKSHINKVELKLNIIEKNVIESLKSKDQGSDKQWNEDDLSALVEKHVILALKNVVNAESDSESKYSFYSGWLSSKFLALEKKLMQLINRTTKSDEEMNYDKMMKVIEGTVVKYVDSIKRNFTELNKHSYAKFDMDIFSEDRIKQIVKEAIMLYDADKIGEVDYALESGGGSILGTRCSETYVERSGTISVFGLPLWSDSNSPRTAIQPDVQPGRCWAFKGSQGFLVVELSATIYPTGFTMEHIPVSLSPSGSIDSAPKTFSVWGLDSEKDSKGNLLGEYIYDINGEPLQYFALQKPSEKPYSYVELQIHSNHGNMEFTCLYRFRVHGKRVR